MNNRSVNKIYNCRMVVNGGGDVSPWIVAVQHIDFYFLAVTALFYSLMYYRRIVDDGCDW